MHIPNVIAVVSRGRQVGKSVIAANLAIAFGSKGYKVLLVDADTPHPSIAEYLGIRMMRQGFNDILAGRVKYEKVLVKDAYENVDVIPGIKSKKPLKFTRSKIMHLMGLAFKVTYYNLIISDMPSDIIVTSSYGARMITLLVATVNSLSVAMAKKIRGEYEKMGEEHRLVANRVRIKNNRLVKEEMEDMYGGNVIAALPEDRIVQRSIEMHIPAYVLDRDSEFSKAIDELSKKLEVEMFKKTAKGESGVLGAIRKFVVRADK